MANPRLVPSTMRASIITAPGDPSVLAVREVPTPAPAAGEVLVRVRAAGLNRADLLQRAGRYPAPPGAPPDIGGIECVGEVVAAGPGAHRWSLGDRVGAIAGGGTHAEFVALPESTLVAMPPTLSWIEAGAIPEVFVTAHDALVTQGKLREGDRVLIHAVGSGVGLAAVQLVTALGGIPFGCSRTATKIERARPLGLRDGAVVTDPATQALPIDVWTGGHGFDLVLDLVGGAYATAALEALAPRGRLILCASLGGGVVSLDLRRVLTKRLTLIGTVLRGRSVAEKAEAMSAAARDVFPHLASGRIVPVVDRVFPLAEIADAHRHLESNETFGKVVIAVP